MQSLFFNLASSPSKQSGEGKVEIMGTFNDSV